MKIIIKKSCGLKILERERIKQTLPYLEGRLLDIGCGCNNLVRNYKGEGIGVDIFPWEGVNLVVTDSAKLNFPDESFDRITFLASLNHIPNRQSVLKEARRLLAPEGKIIITMIPLRIGNFWHLISENIWGESTKGRKFEKGEVGGIDYSDMKELIGEARLKLIERKRFMLGLNNLYILIKDK